MKQKFARIECVPGILGGKPVVKGTRLSVDFILELAASTPAVADIAAAYPDLLTEDDVREAILFAANAMSAREYARTQV